MKSISEQYSSTQIRRSGPKDVKYIHKTYRLYYLNTWLKSFDMETSGLYDTPIKYCLLGRWLDECKPSKVNLKIHRKKRIFVMGDGWSEMRHQCFLLGSAIITPLLRGPGASCTNISSYRLCFSVLRWLATIFKQELWGQGYRVKAKGEHTPTLPPPLTKQADVTRVPQFWCA